MVCTNKHVLIWLRRLVGFRLILIFGQMFDYLLKVNCKTTKISENLILAIFDKEKGDKNPTLSVRFVGFYRSLSLSLSLSFSHPSNSFSLSFLILHFIWINLNIFLYAINLSLSLSVIYLRRHSPVRNSPTKNQHTY